MFTDADMAGINQDFGTLVAKVPCKIKRGTQRGASKVLGAPYNVIANHTCTVMTPAQSKDPYVTTWVQTAGQMTKNARVIKLPMPIPNNVVIRRGDIIVTGTGAQAVDYTVLELVDDATYQFTEMCLCQMAEQENV